jgi:ribokinase
VAAVQLSKLAGACLFLTALGSDDLAAGARVELARRDGLELQAASRPGPQRRAFTFVDREGERTITVLGKRLVPHGTDPLEWERLQDMDAVYFTGGDAAALRAARGARILVATARAMDALREAQVALDVLVASAIDSGEGFQPGELDPEPAWVVRTAGSAGGEWAGSGRRPGRWRAVVPPGPLRDTYGCGDSFAAGVTFALARGDDLPAAVELGARCGAACLTGDGPYAGQLQMVNARPV